MSKREKKVKPRIPPVKYDRKASIIGLTRNSRAPETTKEWWSRILANNEDNEKIWKMLIAKCLDGDMQAIKIWADKVIPNAKDRDDKATPPAVVVMFPQGFDRAAIYEPDPPPLVPQITGR